MADDTPDLETRLRARYPDLAFEQAWERWATQDGLDARYPELRAYVLARIDMAAPDGCWRWSGEIHKTSGPRMHRSMSGGSTLSVRRVVFELLRGPVPRGLHVTRVCGTETCVRPAHMRLVDQRAMAEIKRQRGTLRSGDASWSRHNPERLTRGERHGNASFGEAQVRSILERYYRGEGSTQEIANETGIPQSTIMGIVAGKSWRHLRTPEMDRLYPALRRRNLRLAKINVIAKRITLERARAIRAEYEAGGETWVSMRKRHGLSHGTFRLIVKGDYIQKLTELAEARALLAARALPPFALTDDGAKPAGHDAVAAWHRAGLPRCHLTESQAAEMMLTELSDRWLADVRAPWPCFLIDVPGGLLGGVRHVLVQVDGDCVVAHLASADALGERLTADGWRGLLAWTSPRDAMLAALIVGCCIEFAQARPTVTVPAPPEPPRAESASPRAKSEPACAVFKVTRDVKVDFADLVRAYVAGGGEAPWVRTMVRGHRSRYHVGKGRAQVEWRWVRPHWRGDPTAPVAVRKHKLAKRDTEAA